jgi:molybdate transport system substrate-binding protein
MRHVFPELTRAFEKEHPSKRIVVTFGASGDIARQVEAGAGLDVVVFAGKAPLDKLVQSGHVDALTTKVIGANELVLVGAEGGPKLTFATLDALPAGERLAIGDPKTVPVGQYAREALEGLSLWDKLERRVVLGANVAAVLAYLQRGEVAAAIVYRTEIQGAKGIVVLDVAKRPWAPRPEIWTGVVVDSHDRTTAQNFAHFLASPDGQRVLTSYGFGPP